MSESVKIVSFDGTVDKWKSWKKELMAFYGVKSDKTIKKLLRGDLVAPIVEEDGKMYESRLTQQNEVVRVVDPEGLFVEIVEIRCHGSC